MRYGNTRSKNTNLHPLEDGYAKSYFRKQGKTKEQVLNHILSLNPDTKREAIIKYVDELFS